MKEAIVRLIELSAGSLRRQTKLANSQPDSKKKREKNQINKIRNEKGEVKQTMQKYKEL